MILIFIFLKAADQYYTLVNFRLKIYREVKGSQQSSKFMKYKLLRVYNA